MKIALDARGINWYAGTGIGTYTSQIIKHMLELDRTNAYLLFWWGDNYRNLCNDNVEIHIASKRHKRFFEDFYMPQSLEKNAIDLYHVPQNGIGLSLGLPSNQSCAQVATIHDLIPYVMPETVGRSYLKKFLATMPQIIQNSNRIITVSEFSKRDIMRVFNVEENLINVTPLAAEDYFKPMDKSEAKSYINQKYHIRDPFILYVGGFSPRKNVRSILLAFTRACHHLSKNYKVVILGTAKDEHAYLLSLCETLQISSSVLFAGYVPNEDLPFFYNACSVFVYPSMYEGFGLPPLEAMSCGTPVITSNVSSIPEVVGDSALMINPSDTEDLRNALEAVLENDALSAELSAKGYARSKNFSWKKTALKTLEIYQDVVDKQSL